MKNNLTELLTVKSSAIKTVWYQFSSENFVVDFQNGSSYKYQHVPYSIFEGFKMAESKGRFINAHVKPRFNFTKC
jgi:hypothetical protein